MSFSLKKEYEDEEGFWRLPPILTPSAVSAGLPRASLSPLCSADHGQVRIAYEASSGLLLPFLSGVEWGAAGTPHREGCCSLTKKKKRQG